LIGLSVQALYLSHGFGVSCGTDEIRFWIMTWGSKAVVLEPESLREGIRAEAEGMARRYEGPIVAEESSVYGKAEDVQDLTSF
jgi:hypothetical protein